MLRRSAIEEVLLSPSLIFVLQPRHAVDERVKFVV